LGSERRTHKRVAVEMWVTETHDGATYYQRSANISIGGIYLEGTIPHASGTMVNLKFTIPGDSEPSELRGIVVGDDDDAHLGMHIMFVDLGDKGGAHRRLVDFVKRH
jgi:hypothetical protein